MNSDDTAVLWVTDKATGLRVTTEQVAGLDAGDLAEVGYVRPAGACGTMRR